MKVSELWILIRYKIGWAVIFILTIIPSLRTLSLINQQSLQGSYNILSILGLITGIAGMMLYAINLILATRLRIMEDYFGGLNRMYIAHHLTGGLALILLCFHPLLLAFRLISPFSIHAFRYAAEFLWIHRISFSSPISVDMAINFGIIAFLGMVVLLILTFFIHLPYKIWLITHKFLGAAFFFAELHVLFIKGLVSSDGFLRWYLLFWASLGLISALYRTLGGSILIRRYNYQVESFKLVTKDVIELLLTPIDNKINYQPGQFIFIKFKNSEIKGVNAEAHPFSISSSPKDNQLKITVKALGDYTKSLLKIKVGTIAEIEGAYGKFSYQNYDNPNQIWIAGGIGITPFISMAKSMITNKSLKVDLYYSVKTEEELVNREEFNKIMANKKINFRLIPFVSSKQGFLTADYIAGHSNGIENKDFYICGPTPMMKALRKQLLIKNVPNNRIHSEEFSMS